MLQYYVGLGEFFQYLSNQDSRPFPAPKHSKLKTKFIRKIVFRVKWYKITYVFFTIYEIELSAFLVRYNVQVLEKFHLPFYFTIP